MEDIKFDKSGRIKYNKDIHTNQGKPWNKEDLEYLITWYEFISREEMSFALGRTETSIASKVSSLRKLGEMPQSKNIRRQRLIGRNLKGVVNLRNKKEL